MRQAPGYLFRDLIRVQHYLQAGPRRRLYGDEREVRCHWEGGQLLRATDGRRRHVRVATVYVPRWETTERTYTHTFDREIDQTVIGVNGFVETDMLDATVPLDIVTQVRVSEQRVRPAATFHLEDRIIYEDVEYQIIEMEEYDGPMGPNHFRLEVADQREI